MGGPQIRKFADFNSLLNLQTFHKFGTLRISLFLFAGFNFWTCDLRNQEFFAGLKLPSPQIHTFFLLTNIAYNALIQFFKN